jgi:inorganic pyrophosphatase
MLKMQDEGGEDAKLIAVPVTKILPIYSEWKDTSDINPLSLNQIKHFFEHYKDLEAGKWVKVQGWGNVADAHKEITDGVAAYAKTKA